MPLFTTTDELKAHYPARVTFDMDDLAPTLKSVEQEYLVEMVLGQAQYDLLQAAYNASIANSPTPLPSDMAALLERCRPAVANLAIYHFTGFGNVEFSAGGLVVGQSDVKRPASEWRTRDLERAALRAGYRALDVLLSYLQANAATYTTWNTSEQAAALRAGFLRSTQDLNNVVRIGNSGYLYTKMLPTVRRVEEGAVADTLCSTTYRDSLLTKLTAGNLSASEKKVVELVKKASGHLAMADAIVELSLGMDERGVWTFASLLGGQTSGGPQTASDARLQQRIDHHRNLGNGYLDKLREELQLQAEADSNHPYRTSACYVDPTATPTERFDTSGPVGGFM
jgi:hypothetical protein